MHFGEAGLSTGLFHVTVGESDDGERLDRFVAAAAQQPVLSRTRAQALIADGAVAIDGAPVREAKTKVRTGQAVAVAVPPPAPALPVADNRPLTVLFEDDDLLVLDKPAGLVVHPAAGHEAGTLVNALLGHCGASLSGIGGVRRPGIVHRLDKDTSGLMVVAKSDRAHAGLSDTFADHGRSGSLVRSYRAFVWGRPDRGTGTVEAALARDPHNRLKIAIVPADRGRRAVTHWRAIDSFGEAAALLECRLETGRTHQIRVHMASLGHPLIGDGVYGAGFRTKAARLDPTARAAALDLNRQALHAAELGFAHPVTGAALRFVSPLPDDLVRLEQALRRDSP